MELRKLGLKPKEVRVYLAGLELGPTSVKNISELAEVTRPTAYEIIDRLKEKGLFYTIKEDKKRYFVSQSPRKILSLLRIRKREIEEKEREFLRIIAALEAKYSGEKGEIKIYREKEGLKVLAEEFFTVSPTPEIMVVSSEMGADKIKARDKIYRKIKKRLGKLDAKEIYTKKIKVKRRPKEIRTKVSPTLSLEGTLILCDKIIFVSSKKQEGLLIENELVIELVKSLFSALWKLV